MGSPLAPILTNLYFSTIANNQIYSESFHLNLNFIIDFFLISYLYLNDIMRKIRY